ncbi:MAG TPA: TlpA disulfide reductase family protein [Verrucomicrobiae bacterium]|nr:TlpA disulfide reductase family protein [Verrucomicrobiae bacterium]
MRALIKLIFVVLIGFGCAAFVEPVPRAGENTPKATRAVSPAEIGSAIPQFCLDDLAGRKFCSGQLRGKVLLIDFWASWCGPCKKEMPAYQKFQNAYGPKGLVVIGIGISMDSSANLKKFARALGVHYKLLMGTMRVQDAFGLKGIPTTLLVDRKGIVRARVVGFDYPTKLKPKIQALL